MAKKTSTQESAAQVPAPAKTSAKKARSKRRVAKKSNTKRSAVKKSAVKKRVAKKPVAAKKPVGKKSVGKKSAAKKRKAKKQPTPKINKSQAIRDMANELGKKARPRDIIAALDAKGITVTSPQVSMTLKAAGLRRGRRRKKVATVAAAKRNSGKGDSQTLNIDHLIQVKNLAAKVGGIEKLKETVAALEKLQSVWVGV